MTLPACAAAEGAPRDQSADPSQSEDDLKQSGVAASAFLGSWRVEDLGGLDFTAVSFNLDHGKVHYKITNTDSTVEEGSVNVTATFLNLTPSSQPIQSYRLGYSKTDSNTILVWNALIRDEDAIFHRMP
jgi:hypothetical protein